MKATKDVKMIEHSRHIIESDKSIRPLLDKIEDLADDNDTDGSAVT